jgi:hypothetical protein
VYVLASFVGYLIFSHFYKDIIEECEHPVLTYIPISAAVLALGLWLLGRRVMLRIKEVEVESEKVSKFVSHLFKRIDEEKISYGFAVQLIQNKNYKNYYEKLAIKELKDQYVQLDSNGMIADFENFIKQKERSNSNIYNTAIYFPTNHYHDKMKKRIK